jgi:hypothetical protein
MHISFMQGRVHHRFFSLQLTYTTSPTDTTTGIQNIRP